MLRDKIQIGVIILVVMLGTAVSALPAQVIHVGGSTGKTVDDGVSVLQPGDVLQIDPGVYHAAINVPCDDVTIESAGPGVVLEGAVTLTAKDFVPAAGRPGVYTWHLPDEATDTRVTWIFYNGDPLVYQKSPLDPAKESWAFYVDQKARVLEVVLNGGPIPATAKIVVPTLPVLVEAGQRSHVTVRGLDVRHADTVGISVGPDGIAEDNFVTQAGMFGIVGGTRSQILRNTCKGCSGSGILIGGDSMIVADNLTVANGIQWSDYIDWCASQTKMNVHNDVTFEQNWLVDRPMGGLVKVQGHIAMQDGKPLVKQWVLISGLWPDGDSFNNNYVDNSISRLSHAAIYIEYNADRNVIMANDIQDCAMGITIREGSQNLVTRNWIWDRECLGWGHVDKEGFAGFGPGYDDSGRPITKLFLYDKPINDPAANGVVAQLGSAMWGQQMDDGLSLWHTYSDMTPTSHDNVMSHNLVQVSGMAVSVPLWTYDWPTAKMRQNPIQLTTLSNQLTDNYYTRSRSATKFALLGRTIVKTIGEYQRQTAWDENAKVGSFTPAVIGFEPIWTIPGMAVDTHTPVSILCDPTLETFSSGSSSEPMFWHGSSVHFDSNTAPITKYLFDPKKARSGNCCMSITNVTSTDAMPLWWTSSAIPVKPGITMGASFWVAADTVKPVKAGDGVRAQFRFTDATGHQVSMMPMINDGVRPELVAGTYKYTKVSGKAVVPPGAYWMTVCFGADPSTGSVRFDDVHINMLNPMPPQFSAASK